MRERAGRIGASLSVTSAPGAGTAIVLTVPGRAVFRKRSNRLAGKLTAVLFGKNETATVN